ncbi:hypothetical protein ACT3UM_18970 [Halomonas sp. AOP13-D3-9]
MAVGLFQTNPNSYFRIFVLLTWLWGLAVYNYQAENPVISIFPYLIPVILIAWGHGVKWGFVVAALATLSAMCADYAEIYTQTELIYSGIATYAKLTGAAIGFSLAKIIHKNINPM